MSKPRCRLDWETPDRLAVVCETCGPSHRPMIGIMADRRDANLRELLKLGMLTGKALEEALALEARAA